MTKRSVRTLRRKSLPSICLYFQHRKSFLIPLYNRSKGNQNVSEYFKHTVWTMAPSIQAICKSSLTRCMAVSILRPRKNLWKTLGPTQCHLAMINTFHASVHRIKYISTLVIFLIRHKESSLTTVCQMFYDFKKNICFACVLNWSEAYIVFHWNRDFNCDDFGSFLFLRSFLNCTFLLFVLEHTLQSYK